MSNLRRIGILLNAAGVSSKIFEKLYTNYDLNQIYDGENFWSELGLTFPQQKKLRALISKASFIDDELERLENFHARFVTMFDPEYPARLRDLKRPPIGLYVLGNADFRRESVAIVGTRKCDEYGRRNAFTLAAKLSRAGIIVISGGAKGIDTAAHQGALSVDGVTFAVFGTGLDKIYPKSNRDLFEKITQKGGALISEYAFGTHGTLWTFPDRNRIVTGLVDITVVVQSPEDGGAMITARDAKNLNREVRVIPGSINEPLNKGTNQLVNDGAKNIPDIDEFVAELVHEFCDSDAQLKLGLDEISLPEPEATKIPPDLSDDEAKVYSLIQIQGNRTLDALVSESGLDLMTVNSALMMLESLGYVQALGGRYSLGKI